MGVELDTLDQQLSREALLYGGTDLPAKGVPLRAGPLTMIFQDGGIRYVRLGDREVIRRIYCAVRGPSWETIPERQLGVSIVVRDDSFCIEFQVENVQNDIDFQWKGTIRGEAEGRVVFDINGVARRAFYKNRIGFCVLHPMRECAGARCRVRLAEGNTIESTFPSRISAENLFCDVVSVAHLVMPNIWAELELEGELFEMEDQRNWTDASFKTFCTPLKLPFPVEVKAGQRISQRVTLKLDGMPSSSAGSKPVSPGATVKPRAKPVQFHFTSAAPQPLPRIGLERASHRQPLSTREIERLRHLSLSHLRTELYLFDDEHRSILREANDEACQIGTPIELAIFLSDNADNELAALVSQLHEQQPQIVRCSIFHRDEYTADEKLVEMSREYLASYDHRIRVGWGAWANFAELNRSRRPTNTVDFVTYSLHPQEHASDNTSMIETLEAQAITAEHARKHFGEVPVVVGPITLNKRVNQHASATAVEPPLHDLPERTDVRQTTLFGAAWTLGSVKYLGESGVHGVTYYETTGCLGVMASENGLPMPEHCRFLSGFVFPLFHVLADLAEFVNGEILPIRASKPLHVDGVAVVKERRMSILLANMTTDTQIASIPIGGKQARMRLLDETNALAAMTAPDTFRISEWETLRSNGNRLTLELRPHCLLRVDTHCD